ncbi:MAG: cellulase family glycosylhydrolase [Clostridia bacterium]|nr:cellulase family glycosylhydrolase [Clostridia bacterium]
MKDFTGFKKGMGIGGWLTNYKRFHVLPPERRMMLTIGDFEHFASYITERDVEYIASLGLDHIRLGFDQIVVEEEPYRYREIILEYIENFILWCKKYNLNVVLNLHKSLGNYCDVGAEISLLESEDLQNRFVALWEMMEDRYSEYPDVAFELLNELRGTESDRWNILAERTVKAIRDKSPTRKIIIGGAGGNYPQFLKDLKLYDDENIIYTFHNYAPFDFTHQRGVLMPGCCFSNRDMPYPCDVARYKECWVERTGDEGHFDGIERIDKEYLRREMQGAFDFVKNNPDKILWCGEFGTIRHAKIEWRENYMRDMISLLKEHDIPYCVWNYLSTPNDGNRFSLVDDDNRKILSEEMARIIKGEV